MTRLDGKSTGVAIVVCCIASVGVTGSITTAGDAGSNQVQVNPQVAELLVASDWGENLAGSSLCGVYAACTAVELIGLEADPRDFIAVKYVGKCGGSSPAEVARVVEESGANASILSRLSAVDLRLIECPFIAMVRANPAHEQFDHWVVAVPSDFGMTIFDGLQKPYDIRTAEFLGIWSGIGVCVSRDDNSPLVSIWLGKISLFLTALLGTVLVLRNRGTLGRGGQASAFKQFCGLCAASLVLGVAGNAVFGDLQNYRKGVAIATAASEDGKYRTGTLDDAVKASADPNMLLVDARRELDYGLGTIKGAVNIPVTASIWAIGEYLKKLNRNTPIVVFCQSARCGYDETIAAQLASLGFSDVTVCDEGWSEYKKSAHFVNSQ